MFRRRDKEKKKRQKVDNKPQWTPDRQGTDKPCDLLNHVIY